MIEDHIDFIGIYKNSIDKTTCNEIVDTIERYIQLRSKYKFILG
jgi:hypothetical protein